MGYALYAAVLKAIYSLFTGLEVISYMLGGYRLCFLACNNAPNLFDTAKEFAAGRKGFEELQIVFNFAGDLSITKVPRKMCYTYRLFRYYGLACEEDSKYKLMYTPFWVKDMKKHHKYRMVHADTLKGFHISYDIAGRDLMND